MIAVVTGANRGIGLEVARQLAEAGHHVVLTGRDADRLAVAVAGLAADGLDVSGEVCDVCDADSVKALATRLAAAHGRIDILVNNAGVALDKFVPGLEVGLDVVRATYDTNVFGVLACCQALIPLMQGSGRVVNVTSELASMAEVQMGSTLAYRSSKAAVHSITALLAAELRDTRVLVNAAMPGWCQTELGGAGAPRTAAEGADTIVWLATLPAEGPEAMISGGFFRDRERFPH